MASKSIVSIAVGICIVCILGIVVSLHIYRENRAADAVLDRADSLLTAGEADAAMSLLDSIRYDAMRYRRSRHYRYRLLEADAMNKTYRPFTTDSILKEVARYYDGWRGTPTKRLRARYLLGCAYRDMKEAPLALITWEDAVASADTTSANCDYATLYRIYGQMASIYFRQYMPEKELEARQKLCRYALKAGDTLNYIRGMLKWNDAYLSLHDTVAVLKNTENVRQLYLTRGLTQEAAQVYPSVIQVALDREEYSKADSMMQIFERESGLFDEQGNIAKSRELYYYHKGRYYASVGFLDSAEYQFRRLLPFVHNKIDAYYGFLFLFRIQQKTDSIVKYAYLYESAMADYLNQTQTNAVVQADAMYNFERQMRNVQKEENRARKWKRGGILASFVICIITLVIYICYIKAKSEKKSKEAELRHLTETYLLTREHLNKALAESQILHDSLSDNEELKQMLRKKTEQVDQLEANVDELKEKIDHLESAVSCASSREAKMLIELHSIANGHYEKLVNGSRTFVPARCATTTEWEQVMEVVQACHPRLYLTLNEHKVTDAFLKVCILSRYGFNNSEISALTGMQIKSISNVRTKVAREHFNLSGAYELNKYLTNIQ